MISYFVDTSALAKRYLRTEVGHQWIRGELRKDVDKVIVISEIALAEMTSLAMRRRREGTLSNIQYDHIQRAFLSHLRTQYRIILLDSFRIKQSRRLLVKHPLRTLDAIQLASALEVRRTLHRPILFLSSDNNLLNAAAAEGFTVDNPLLHP